MPARKGKAWSVFPTQQRDSTRAVTQVTVRPTDPDTVRYAKDMIAQSQAVVPEFAPDPEIAFYVPATGPQIAPGDDLVWGTHQVTWTSRDGKPRLVDKIGYDFWPAAPLH